MYSNSSNGLGFIAPGAVVGSSLASGPAAPVVAAIGLALSLFPVLLAKIGRGRAEADTIVPVQNAVGQQLAAINQAIDTSSISALQDLHRDTEQIGANFEHFVKDPSFTDGRASMQALDTIMPLIDGTDSHGIQVRSDRGTLGSIERRILALGGTIPAPTLTQGYGTNLPTLRTQTQNYPYIPQSGTIPPNAPLSPIRASMLPAVSSASEVLPLAAVALLALVAFRRRR